MSKIIKVWTFKSDSNPDKSYETLQYDDESTSCNCMGWTRRVAADGSRTCKHTRLVDQGLADGEAVSFKDYGSSKVVSASGALEALKGTKGTTKPKPIKDESNDPMDKDLKDLDKNWESKRKIKWK
jgi:hypothetical protein